MQSAITRLALLQFVVIFYSIFCVGVLLKLRFGSPAPPIFATHLRDYGFLLLLFPAAWLMWASSSAHRPLVGTGEPLPIVGSGLVLLVLLVILAFLGTISTSLHGSTVRAVSSRQSPATPPP